MFYLLNIFFICSIIGFILEQGMMNLFHQPYNSSLLHGPWTIVYGLASLVILKIGSITAKLKVNKFARFFLFVLINFIALSLIEFTAGFLIYKVLGIVYWDYSHLPFHIGKFVSLLTSLVWCLYAVLLNYLCYPFLKKLALKIPKFITIIIGIIILIDIVYSTWEYLVYN